VIHWNESKNERLKRERGLPFEMVLEKIDANQFLSVERHPKRSNQWILVLELNEYPQVVPQRNALEEEATAVNPKYTPLDPEELEVEEHLNEYIPVPRKEAEAMIDKALGRRSVTIRLNVADVNTIKRIAEREALPYQTLIGSVLHKYAEGRLVDIEEIQRVFPKAKRSKIVSRQK
jgi:predicted DNA binding CopG/RHH family protein